MKFSDRDFGKWSHKAVGLSSAKADKARKVCALINRGATAGERNAAINRLQAIADEAGVPSHMLLERLSS